MHPRDNRMVGTIDTLTFRPSGEVKTAVITAVFYGGYISHVKEDDIWIANMYREGDIESTIETDTVGFMFGAN